MGSRVRVNVETRYFFPLTLKPLTFNLKVLKYELVSFGTFEARQRQARTSQNPRTGEKLEIPATTFPLFTADKGFKERVAAKA